MTNNGDYRVCCDILHAPWAFMKDESGRRLNAKTDPVERTRNSAIAKELRASMMRAERHTLCGQCWRREDLGLDSKRRHHMIVQRGFARRAIARTSADGSIDPQDFPVSHFDLRLGNGCNLRCRTCGPTESSLWVKDWFESHRMKGGRPHHMHYYGLDYPISESDGKVSVGGNPFDWDETARLFDELERARFDLRELYFTGGEPLINRPHWALLEKLASSGVAAKIEIRYDTNLVTVPDSAFAVWPAFKKVSFACSIDGVGNYAEYLRPPSKWQTIHNNLLRISRLENAYIEIAPTISAMNIHHIPDLVLWFLKARIPRVNPVIWTHILFQAPYFSCQVLPAGSKREVARKYAELWPECERLAGRRTAANIRARLEPVVEHMFADDRSRLLSDFFEHTSEIDRLHGRALSEGLPELWRLLTAESSAPA
jgi:hypothetical protein